MTFAGTARVHQSLPAWRRLARAGVAMAAAATLLTACGGGDQVKEFQATKLVSFGDENSALVEVSVGGAGAVTTIKGLKYGVNSVGLLRTAVPSDNTVAADSAQPAWLNFPTSAPVAGSLTLTAASNGSYVVLQDFVLNSAFTDGKPNADLTVRYLYTYYCSDYPLWIQSLARNYGLGYRDQCPTESGSGAVTYAAAGATVADTAAQFAAHRGEIGAGSLATIMAGQNDILAAYAQVKAGTLDIEVAKRDMNAQGKALAAVINDIYNTGAHVLFVKLPNLGFSPLARADGSLGQDRLRELTLALNNGLLTNVRNDGLRIGLVNFYDRTFDIDRRPNDYGVSDMASAVCKSTVYRPDGSAVTPAVPAAPGGDQLLYCNTLTLDRSAETFFWSDSVNLSPRAHAYLAELAYRRAFDETF